MRWPSPQSCHSSTYISYSVDTAFGPVAKENTHSSTSYFITVTYNLILNLFFVKHSSLVHLIRPRFHPLPVKWRYLSFENLFGTYKSKFCCWNDSMTMLYMMHTFSTDSCHSTTGLIWLIRSADGNLSPHFSGLI